MTISEFMKFVDGQRDPRLNEILFPFCNSEKAQELIAKYEPNQFNVKVSICTSSTLQDIFAVYSLFESFEDNAA